MASESFQPLRRLAALFVAMFAIPSMALAQTGGISGVVTGAGNPLAGVVVNIYDASQDFVKSSQPTNATGNYDVLGLADGPYYAYATGAGGFVSTLYPDIPCVGGPNHGSSYCGLSTGGQIVVAGGSVSGGIDFALQLGGSIAGSVAVDGAPYAGATVELHLDLGQSASWIAKTTVTSAGGAYQIGGLPVGDYYVWAGNTTGGGAGGYVPELFSEIPCRKPSLSSIPRTGGCSLATATVVSVTAGGIAPADFDLEPGSAIRGTAWVDGLPATGVFVDTTINPFGLGAAGASPITGRYLFSGASAGQTTLYAAGNGYTAQPGAPVDIAAGGQVIDGPVFNLAPSPRFRIIRQPLTQSVTSGGSVSLSALADGVPPLSFQWYAGASGDTSSPIGGATSREYVTPAVTTPTSYWVRVTSNAGSLDSATANVTIAPAGTGSFSGRITSSNQPIEGTYVNVYSSSEQFVKASVPTSASGAFSVAGLSPGNYYAFVSPFPMAVSGNVSGWTLAMSPAYPWTDVLYPSTPCASEPKNSGTYCRINTGTPITVSADAETSGIDVNIPMGGVIAGAITVQGEIPNPTAGTQVSVILDSVAVPFVVANGHVDPTGNYVIPRLPAGDYRVVASSSNMLTEVWDDIQCPPGGCLSAGGTSIGVTPTVTIGGKDFDLFPAPQAPSILTQPRSQVVDAGQSAVLTVHASGQPQPILQWYLGQSGDTSSPISGATSSTYDTGPVTANTAYWVRVSNGVGTVDSAAATVAVNPGAYGGLVGGSGGGVTTGGGTIGPGAHRRGGRASGGGGTTGPSRPVAPTVTKPRSQSR